MRLVNMLVTKANHYTLINEQAGQDGSQDNVFVSNSGDVSKEATVRGKPGDLVSG